MGVQNHGLAHYDPEPFIYAWTTRNARLIQLWQGISQPILDMALLFSPFVRTHSPPPAPPFHRT